MTLSKHAKARGQQRGINARQCQLTFQYGRSYSRKGAEVYSLTKKQCDELIRENMISVQEADKLSNLVVIVSLENEVVLTSYHPKQKFNFHK